MDYCADFVVKDQEKKVVVGIVGDAMLDEYYRIDSERISPEYPIPVEVSESDEPFLTMPGGAANVAHQMQNCNAYVSLFCLADLDAKQVFDKFGFHTHAVIMSDADIPRKKRYCHKRIPAAYLSRRDVEKYHGTKEYRTELYSIFKEWVKSVRPDVVIMTDYNKGVFNYDTSEEGYLARRLINICRQCKVPVVVDPKSGPLEQWRGCTLFKPNRTEATAFTGTDEWKDQLVYIHNALVGRHRNHQVVITRGGESVVGYDDTGPWEITAQSLSHLPDIDEQSVIGAGDCFVSFLAMAYARGFKPSQAAVVAYVAGANYIQQRHNQAIYPRQLLGGTKSKIIRPIELDGRNFNIAWTNGAFDLVHPGHVSTLQHAKDAIKKRHPGGKLVVGVDSDQSVRKLKGRGRPINPLADRMEVIAALGCVDYVVSFHTDGLYQILKNVKPDIIVKAKGKEYLKNEDVVGHDIVGPDNVVWAPLLENRSSTRIMEIICTTNLQIEPEK